jgi:photosystem II stability/assembly factor-like uncharacterized protein
MKKFSATILILLFSSSAFSQWALLNSGTSINLNAVHFMDMQTGYAAGVSGTVLKTTNSGLNWVALNTGSAVELRAVHFFNTSTGLVCGYGGTILKTTNNGDNWNVISSGTTSHLLGMSFYNDTVGICAGNSGTILYTTNGGISWLVGTQGYMVTFHSAYMVNASTGYCVGVNTIFAPFVAKTVNGGANWAYSTFYLNNNEGTLRDLYFFDPENGIAVSNLWNGPGGISHTTNGGTNWSTQIYSYALYGVDFPVPTTGYAVGFNGYILKSTDSGNSWLQQTSGTAAFLKAVDFIDSINGYAVGDGGTILKTTNGGVTSVPNNLNELPLNFKLYQNYPNPFNPKSKIKFQITKLSYVKLIVYDAIGREVATLVNEQLRPGTYEVDWNGGDYPSGVYFYKMIAGDNSMTKKMLLIK